MLTPQQSERQLQRRERRMQIGGLLLIALLVLIFTLWRAGWHAVVPHGW